MTKMTDSQRQDLQRLADLPDAEIDTSDTPELTDFTGAVRGRFYRPIKQQVTLRLDADLLAWFKAHGGKYQTRINAALREYVEGHQAGKGKREDATR
jgi:uncharacterized protein (DUF4415 family)